MAKGKKRLAFASAAMLGLLCAPAAWAANADTVYTNGTIYTMEDFKAGNTYDFTKVKNMTPRNLQKVEVVAAKDGKVVFAGSKADAEAAGMMDGKVVDLKGRTMMPGFIDGHGHFPGQGQVDLYSVFLGSPPLGTMTSVNDIVQALDKACEASGEYGVTGSGYDDTLIYDKRHPGWEDIEMAEHCKGKAVRLSHISGHVSVASKKLLMEAGMMDAEGNPTELAKNTTGVEIDKKTGKVTGVLYETIAMGAVGTPVTPTSSQDQAVKEKASKTSLARANEYFLSKGVTMADDGLAVLTPGGGLNTYQAGLAEGNLRIRVAVHPVANPRFSMQGFTLPGAYTSMVALGWEIGNPAVLAEESATMKGPKLLEADFAPVEGVSPKTGEDVTMFTQKDIPGFPGVNVDPAKRNIPAKYQSDRIFLGAYKILGDGSPQAYTAWMKDPGNYNWGTYTAQNRFALSPDAWDQTPLLNTEYDTTENSAAPTPPPYFNGLPGTVNVYPKDLQAILELMHKNGHSTEIHTNGSAYAEAWVEALEKAVSKYPTITDTRHCSIHAQTFERNILERLSGNYASVNREMTTQLFGALGNGHGQPGTGFDSSKVNGVSEADLSKYMKAQNFFPNFFITHTYYYGERHRDIFFGPGRANNISPVGWNIHYGLPFAFHNDNTVTPIEPLQSVESAVTRLSARSLQSDGGQLISGTGKDIDATVTLPSRAEGANSTPIPGSDMKFYNYDQRINGAQGFVGVTIGAAYQNKLDDRMGSIAVGKFADFVILDEDPVQMSESNPTRMSDIRVTTTIVGDEPLYGVLPGSTDFIFNVTPAYTDSQAQGTISDLKVSTQVPEDDLVPLDRGYTRLGAFQVTGNITGSRVATLQAHFLGNNQALKNYKVFMNGDVDNPAQYGRSNDANHWWVAEASAPTVPLAFTDDDNKDTILAENGDYILTFTVPATTATAGGANTFDSVVELQAPGNAPTNETTGWWSDDDDNSGCTVGSKPAYDLGVLAAMFAGLFGLSGLRRRFAKKN